MHYANCNIFAHIPKMNSVSTSFNINNNNIIKKLFALNQDKHCKDIAHT